MKNSLCHRFKVKTFAAAALLAAFGMQSCQDENLVGQPTWLNNSICRNKVIMNTRFVSSTI